MNPYLIRLALAPHVLVWCYSAIEALILLGCIVFLNVKRDLCLQRQVVTYVLL